MMVGAANSVIYTVGHSNHHISTFLSLLSEHNVTAIVDVRSSPYSRWSPQYSRKELSVELKLHGIAYVFLGKELGARSENPECYVNGKVQYCRLAEEPAFEMGIARVRVGASKYRIALMCAEKDPIDCHRALLVSRELHERGFGISHILADGRLETQKNLERRLLQKFRLPENDLVSGREFVDEAYRKQEDRVAYLDEKMAGDEGGL
jgi:uncharacterized protein (DUF488 family)